MRINMQSLSPSTLLLLPFFLRVICGLCVICWHQEEWGILFMKILCPHWPLLDVIYLTWVSIFHAGLPCEVCNPAGGQVMFLRPQSMVGLGILCHTSPGACSIWCLRLTLKAVIILTILLISVNKCLNAYKMATNHSQINPGSPKNIWKLYIAPNHIMEASLSNLGSQS
uniref:Uncharacterized protein n=1 Tax=Pipistrellus kuhlii TaxID=59472 RepID=A0A7J7YWR7_PIPKU|nr:hypothetical protein mPipKuh1_009889 [Pipistrellus kuhlii]